MGIKRLLALFICTLLFIAALSSCKVKDKGGNGGGNADDNVIWSPDVTLGIVLEKGT